MGGALTRHDVHVQQRGPRTDTNMKHFLLASANQLHDLHSRLVLQYPEVRAVCVCACVCDCWCVWMDGYTHF